MDSVVLLNDRSFKGTVQSSEKAMNCIIFVKENGHTLTIPWSAIAWIDYGDDEPKSTDPQLDLQTSTDDWVLPV